MLSHAQGSFSGHAAETNLTPWRTLTAARTCSRPVQCNILLFAMNNFSRIRDGRMRLDEIGPHVVPAARTFSGAAGAMTVPLTTTGAAGETTVQFVPFVHTICTGSGSGSTSPRAALR